MRGTSVCGGSNERRSVRVRVCVFSVLQEKVVLPKVIVVGGDEQVSPRPLQPPAQEVPPLVPLQELLLTVGVVAARTLDTAAVQPVKHARHVLRWRSSSRARCLLNETFFFSQYAV